MLNHRSQELIQQHCIADVVIIGSGASGLYQIFQLGLLNITCITLEASPKLGGQCAHLYADKVIYDVPSVPSTSARALIDSLLIQIQPFKPQILCNQHVEDIFPSPTPPSEGVPHQWRVTTEQGLSIDAYCVIIATGAGAFIPKRLNFSSEENLIFQSPLPLYYEEIAPSLNAEATSKYQPKIVIYGNSESALSSACQLVHWGYEHVLLIYRRKSFKAPDSLVAEFLQLELQKKIRFLAAQIKNISPSPHSPSESISSCTIYLQTSDTGELLSVAGDYLLIMQGLTPSQKKIKQWQNTLKLSTYNSLFQVDPHDMQTSQKGIFAIGDCAHYPGKHPLLTSAFYEATQAAYGVFRYIYAQEAPLLYTTSSSILHKRLTETSAQSIQLNNPEK